MLLVIVLLILISEGSPIFYLRRVVGPDGEFDAYKFRTMCPDADAVLQVDPRMRDAFAQNFKLRSDPRVTRIGEWLRKCSPMNFRSGSRSEGADDPGETPDDLRRRSFASTASIGNC